ncbi:MAG: hypothetical protein HY204_08220 [Nitrospirae bacterium]|nr:hypothetical protein [Nitrospirota bacterium]
MKKSNSATLWRAWRMLGTMAVLGLALGCGTVGGSGQCNGVDATGACITIDSIAPFDSISGKDTSSVDVIGAADCGTGKAEPFGDHSAKVTISATLMTGAKSPPAPGFIDFNGYTVLYTPSSTNLVTAPPLTTMSFPGAKIHVNTDGSSVTTTLELMNTQTKTQYVSGGGSLYPAATYTATYTITGTTQFNQEVILIGSTTISIGNYDNCP